MVSQVAAVKTIIRRPWVHHVIIWGYIIAPVANILLASAFLGVPVITVVQRMARGYGTLGAVWLLTAPLMGVALYFVNRVVWYLFLAHSSLVFADIAYKWIARPLLFLHGIPPLNHLLIVCGNLALVALIGYIIQRDFRAPYFQVLQRSFREHKRLPIRHGISLDGTHTVMNDLSVTGCFVPSPVEGPGGPLVLNAGHMVAVSFSSETLTLTIQGQVMRETPSGWGIRFLSVSRREKQDIARLLKNRYTLRYKVDLPAQWGLDDPSSAGRTIDISASGCFVSADVYEVEPGRSAVVSVDVGGTRIAAPGTIVWLNREGSHHKPPGFGFHYKRPQQRLVRLVRRRLGKLELTR
jgi:hypothetical protein